ncbi:hypothetical protein Ahy_B02g060797 [Arachis hypogaea]|uniref:Pentatricopeptide repeat-containing protein n=1 Tax=Arachis hypogaea TaxID=3818 RepID=A0A445AJC0_ARAHY|nr:hypothetical protein Ahy_B02g060797 [Arachis hypogaea]
MIKRGLSPNVTSYNIMINRYCKNKVDEAITLFEGMRKKYLVPDIVSYGTLIDGFIGLCKLGRTSKVQNLLADMHYSGHIPNSITYNALLDSLCKAQYLTRQLHYFKNLWTKDQSRSVYVQYYSKGFVQMQKTKDCKRIFSTSCDQQL